MIDAEMKASFYGDYQSWTKLLANKPYTFWQIVDHEDYRYWEGWKEISDAAKDIIKPATTAGKMYEGYYDLNIRIYKKAAAASFKSKTTVIQQEDHEEYKLTGMQIRFLEKNKDE